MPGGESLVGSGGGNADELVVLSGKMRAHARPAPILRAFDQPRGDLGVELELPARQRGRIRVPLHVVDGPEACDYFPPTIIDRAPLTVAISTEGDAPVLARLVRAQIEALLPPGVTLTTTQEANSTLAQMTAFDLVLILICAANRQPRRGYLETRSRARKHQAETDLGADHAEAYTVHPSGVRQRRMQAHSRESGNPGP